MGELLQATAAGLTDLPLPLQPPHLDNEDRRFRLAPFDLILLLRPGGARSARPAPDRPAGM
jgi:hypothetical protein